jgi:Mg-chelatase subunit ChlD
MLRKCDEKYNKDVVFLMDFSQSMEINSRVKFAINAYLEFFDNYLFEKDRIAMLRFNNMIHIDFELN